MIQNDKQVLCIQRAKDGFKIQLIYPFSLRNKNLKHVIAKKS